MSEVPLYTFLGECWGVGLWKRCPLSSAGSKVGALVIRVWGSGMLSETGAATNSKGPNLSSI